MTRRGALALIGTAMSAVLAGCGELAPAKYRFRMTVEIETPSGLKSGSGVMEVTSYKATRLTSEEHVGGGGLTGEAVAIDLPDGPVFALLQTQDGGQAAEISAATTRALAGPNGFGDIDGYVAAVRMLGNVAQPRLADLPRTEWPMMVRFRDINDPKSVEQVDPAAIGVKRIAVATTSDAVTTGIVKRLGWLGNDPLTLGNHGLMGPPMAGGYLNNQAFWNGVAK